MKKHILTLAKVFPSDHPRSGQPTNFYQKVMDDEKLHTLRKNFSRWEKIINQVNAREAMLLVNQWIGRPYYPPGQESLFVYSAGQVRIQKVIRHPVYGWGLEVSKDEYRPIHAYNLAKNDGLELEDFEAWFKDYDLERDGPLACIHFQDKTYKALKPNQIEGLFISDPNTVVSFTYKHKKND